MKKPVVVIGLGHFGSRLARSLAARGVEVVAVDRRRDLVEEIKNNVALAVSLDATDENAIKPHLPKQTGVAVVGVGQNFESTLLITANLKQLGVPRVIARAASVLQARILARIGADETVDPEEESADRWANRISAPKLLNQLEFHEGYSIVEIAVPGPWEGKSLAELNLRASLGLHVVAVKRPRPDEGGQRVVMPQANDPLRPTDVLVLMGRDEDFIKVPT